MKTIKKLFVLLLCMYVNSSSAVIYYSKTNGGNWNDNNSWSTTGYGQATNTGTFPKSGDYAYIGDGYTIIVNVACTTSYLIIGQGSSGSVDYSDAGNYSLVVINNLTVSTGAALQYAGNNSRTHTLQVGNNLSCSGTMDLYSDANDVVNLTFYRSANTVITGNGTYDLNTVTIQKSTATSYYVEVQSTSFESGIRDLVLTYGTFYHNNSSTYNVNSSAGSGFTIPADGVVKVNAGVLHLSTSHDDCILNGSLTLLGGTLRVGSSTGNGGLRYEKPGAFTPRLDIQGGTMEVYGGLTYKAGASSSPFIFSIGGGTLKLNGGSSGFNSTIFHVNDVSGSSCTITDGFIIIEKPNTTGTTVSDMVICGSMGSVTTTGGTLQFGGESSGAGLTYTFTPVSNVTLPNIYLTGPVGNTATLAPSVSSTANIKAISLHVDVDMTFDIRSVSGTTGDSRTITLTGNFDGINSILCDGTYVARTSQLILQGSEGQQISGIGTMSVYDLEVDGSGTSIGMPVTLNGTLTLTNGILYTTGASLFTIGTAGSVGIGSESSYIDGPLAREIISESPTTFDFPIGKNGSYRPLQLTITHSNSGSATYTAEVNASSPRDLGFSLPGTIDRISAQRYLSLDRSGSANLSSATLTYYYGDDDGVTDPSNLRLVQFDGTSSWTDLGGTGSGTGSGNISSSSSGNLNTYFALGNSNGGSNPLPVTYLYFKAEMINEISSLEWATASEKNSDYFEVQKSIDGRNFEAIGRVGAAGNSTEKRIYHFVDQHLLPTVVYYRLKQVDLNGEFTYSSIRVLNAPLLYTMNVFPNPVTGQFVNIDMNTNFQGLVRCKVTDASGRLLEEQVFEQNGPVLFWSADRLQNGQTYQLSMVNSNGEQQTSQIIIAR